MKVVDDASRAAWGGPPSPVDGGDEPHPLAFEPSWRAFRDAFHNLIAHRGGDDHTYGDAWDDHVIGALAALRLTASPGASLILPELYEAGTDVGRWVYARDVVGDDIHDGLAALSGALHRSGLGTLSHDGLIRRVAVTFTPSAGALRCETAPLDAYVGGILSGFLGEVANARPRITFEGGFRYALTLAEGVDPATSPLTRPLPAAVGPHDPEVEHHE